MTDDSARKSDEGKKFEAAVRAVMPGFAPVADDNVGFAYGGWPAHRRELAAKKLPLPGLIQLIFGVLGSANLGRAEKLAWEFVFEVDGTRCSVASQKFGLRLYIAHSVGDEAAADALANRIQGALIAAQRVVERGLLRPMSAELIAAGEVTVRNQHHALRQVYEYFREGARLSYAGEGRLDVTGYFSFLEHTLVGCLPLSDFDPAADSVVGFLGATWGEKFHRVLDPKNNRDAMSMFNRLHRIAEQYRNTYSHGGFDKAGATVAFHVPGWGAFPAALSDVRTSPHFEFLPLSEATFDEICEAFDECDQLLRDGKTRDGMLLAESGLDIRFDAQFRAMVVKAKEDDDVVGLLNYLGAQWERAINMDW